jgi:hypothetical protein
LTYFPPLYGSIEVYLLSVKSQGICQAGRMFRRIDKPYKKYLKELFLKT